MMMLLSMMSFRAVRVRVPYGDVMEKLRGQEKDIDLERVDVFDD